MARPPFLLRLLDRLTSQVPSGPADRPRLTSMQDPNEPGISAEARQARLRLLLARYEKKGRGTGR